jgi:uncharacterized protein YggU (UPF0235/DUF167 family)
VDFFMELPELELAAGGILLPVQAFPGSRKNAVNGVRQGRLMVCVTQAREKRKANEAIVEILADALGLKRRQISLISGETSPLKKFLITGLELADLSQRIADIDLPTNR